MGAVKFVNSNKITVWYSVPSLAGRLTQIKSLAANTLPTLRITLFGGEQLPAAIVDAWRLAAPNSIIENFYGPTEVTVFCLAQRVGTPTPLSPGRDVVSIGTPLPCSEAAILDSNGDLVTSGVAGELAIAGAQLATGYLDADELTAGRFPVIRGKRWYLTGDLACEGLDGNFHHLGRIDNQVKVLGHRIELEELDSCLRTAANASSVAVVAWPFLNGTAQGLVGFVAAPTVNSHAVIDAMSQRLPTYAVPARLIAVNELPHSSSGKIDRKALCAQLDRGAA
jgi:acyl-coenzyme A synthetase/AMP-(fatty) acid ligase